MYKIQSVKKGDFENMKKRIIALLIVLSCITSGCKDNNVNDNYEEYVDNQFRLETIIEDEKKDETSLGYSDGEIQDFIKDAEFKYSCPNQIFDIDTLYQQILNNNYTITENNMFFCPSTASEEEKEEAALCQRALLQALHICFDNASNDVYEDFCKLSTIHIQRGYPENVASYYYEKNLIIVYTEYIKLSCDSVNKKDYQECLANILAHEINHARQFSCRHSGRIDYSLKNYGFTAGIESSAESQLYNLGPIRADDKTLHYPSTRKLENQLLLIPSCAKGKQIDDYYNAYFNSDLKSMYKFFGLETKSDYRTFYDILYSIESLDGQTDYSKNESKYNIVLSMGVTYKISIFNMATSNLLKTINENNLSLEDSMMLYSLIKGEIFFCNSSKYELTPEYIDALNNGLAIHEENFKSSILDIYHISSDDFDEAFEFAINSRYLNINEDALLDDFPILRKIINANPITPEDIATINNKNKLSYY